MSDEPRDDDESQVSERRDELLRRMLKTPPKPHKPAVDSVSTSIEPSKSPIKPRQNSQ